SLPGLGSTAAAAAEPADSGVIALVSRASNECFSAAIRVAGMLVARSEAMVFPEVEGYRIVEIFKREGDMVTANQDLARLTRSAERASPPSAPATAVIRAPVAGLVIQSNAVVGATASARAGPLFRIAVDGEIELVAEVPSIYVPKLEARQSVRIVTE